MNEHCWIARALSGLAVALFASAPALAGEPLAAAPPGSTNEAPTGASPQGAGPPPGATPASGPTDGDTPDWLQSLDIAAHLGVGVRLDDPPVLDSASRAGLLYGLGLDLFVSDKVSLGLHFEHLDLGEEGGDLFRSGTLKLTRDLNSLWIRVRAYPWRSEHLGVYVALAGGPTWQSADAVGMAWSSVEPGNVEPFACAGSDSVDVAMRAAVGIDGAPSPPVRFFTSLGLDTYRLTDAVLDGCVPGAGTAAVLGIRAGMAYGIGL